MTGFPSHFKAIPQAYRLGRCWLFIVSWIFTFSCSSREELPRKLVDLKGPWEFYWQRLHQPADSLGPADAHIEAGKAWNGTQLKDGNIISGQGWATYRLKMNDFFDPHVAHTLKIPDVASAARIYIFPEDRPQDVRILEMGQVATVKDQERPSRYSQSISFVPGEKTWILLVQISNHSAHKGGMWKIPRVGPSSELKKLDLMTYFQTTLSMGVMLAIGVYSLMIWLRNRESWESFWLFGMSLGSILRAVSIQEITISLLPESFYAAIRSLEYSTLFIGPLCYLAFLHYSFLAKDDHRSTRLLLMLGSFMALIPLVTPQTFYGRLLPMNQIFLLLLLSLCLWNIAKAVRKKERHTNLAVLGIAVIVAAFITDYLYLVGIWNVGFYTMPSAVAIFLLLQAQIVAAHSADAFARAEFLAVELKEKERARTLFFHNTSHELRTPLNGIIGFLDLVRQGQYGDVSPGAKNQVGKALRLAESLKLQVNTILDLAKSRRGELSLKLQSLSLEEIHREACLLAEGLALKGQGLIFQAQFRTDHSPFVGDKEKIFTIIRNLLGNAFKFKDSHRENTVSLILSLQQGQLECVVSDTGIGIPEEAREKIFEEFSQIQGDARRGYEGTGLGLAMVRDLVKLMAGEISLVSKLGEGSQFLVRIKSSPQDSANATESNEGEKNSPKSMDFPPGFSSEFAETSIEVSPSDASSGEVWTIYVIDDNETNCEVISGILRVDGYQVRTAISGRIGLDEMRYARPDILLLDMMMPEMSGEDVLRVMRQDPVLQEIPVILITARASEEDRIEGLKLGADDYLAKPIFAAELRLRVKNMVHRHKLLRQVEQAEKDDKLLHLGEMFGELSHELKNILNHANSSLDLEGADGIMSAMVLSLPEDMQVVYGQKLVAAPVSSKESRHRFERISRQNPQPLSRNMDDLAFYLSEMNLEEKTFYEIWQKMQGFSEAELEFASRQAKLFYQYKMLLSTLHRSKDLTYSVLEYARITDDISSAQVEECWRQVSRLIQSRLKNLNVTVEVDMQENCVYIPLSRFTQVIVNLMLNALDAMELLPTSERWIRVTTEKVGDKLLIKVINSGPAIAEHVQKKLFQRGFSTKGSKGSGIGLYVSRRILREVGGDLQLDASHPTPCFVVKLLLAHESGQPLFKNTSPGSPQGALGA